jgi:uncharacterized delta-60 repeat protein
MKKRLLFAAILMLSNSFAQTVVFDPTFNGGGHIQTSEISAYQKLLVIDNENYYINNFDGNDFQIDKLTNNISGNAALSNYANDGNSQQFVDFEKDASGNVYVLGESFTGDEWSWEVYTRLQKLSSANTNDPSFNSGNEFLFNDPVYDYYPRFVRILSDGKIMIAGIRNNLVSYLMRLNANGTIDNTFGTDGIQLINDVPFFEDLIMLSDGKMLFSGNKYSNAHGATKVHVGRLNSDGTLDNTFGTNGMSVLSYGQSTLPTYVNKMIINTSGEIFVCGFGLEFASPTNRAVGYTSKLDQNGIILSSFGNASGFYNPDVLFSQVKSSFHAVEILNDGNIVVAGSRFSSSGNFEPILVFLNSTGSLNTNYGTSGIHSLQSNDFYGYYNTINELKQQADGKLVYYLNSEDPSSTSNNYVGRVLFESSANTSDLNDNTFNQLSIFPNPGSGLITLAVNQPTSAVFTSANGAILAHLELNGESSIDVSTYAPGIYFIRTAEGQTVKFIKE